MNEIEKMAKSDFYEGDVVGPVVIDIPEARALVVGPDEILVVVFPSWVSPAAIVAHRAHLKQILGERFMLATGDDIQLAKVKPGDWARPVVEGKGRG